MTTIAYNHKDKEIAVDSRATRNSFIDSDNVDKSIIHNGVMFFICGASCDDDLILSYYDGIPLANLIPDCKAVYIKDGKAYEFWVNEDCIACTDELINDTAFGSGANFAIAAMDFGKSAKQAVKYAMTRDTKTGGKVRVFKVE